MREAPFRGQDQSPFFAISRDELEEQMRTVAVDRDVADIVDDQELGLIVELQPLFDAVFGLGLGERGDERNGLGEVGPMAFGHSLDAQGHRQMGIADAGRSQKDDVLAIKSLSTPIAAD